MGPHSTHSRAHYVGLVPSTSKPDIIYYASKPDSKITVSSTILRRLHKMYSKKGFLYDIYLLLIVYY